MRGLTHKVTSQQRYRSSNHTAQGRTCCQQAYFCMLISTVDLEKIHHGTPLTEINNVVDDGLLLIAPTVLEAPLRLRPKLHRFDLSLYLLRTWLYGIGLPATNRLSGVWALSSKYVVKTDIFRSACSNLLSAECLPSIITRQRASVRPTLVAWQLYLVGSAIWSILREAA